MALSLENRILNRLRLFFWLVDIGFILYWIVTLFGLIPHEWLFEDYQNPLLVAWNWSFLPLDLAASLTGIYCLYLLRLADSRARDVAFVSLALTSASGFQAISFWAFRLEFEPSWWIPNLFLLIYPWFFIIALLRARKPQAKAGLPTATHPTHCKKAKEG